MIGMDNVSQLPFGSCTIFFDPDVNLVRQKKTLISSLSSANLNLFTLQDHATMYST